MKLIAALFLLASVAHATGYVARDPKAAAPVVLSKADGSALYDATGGGAGSTANLTVFQGSGTQSTTAWLVELTSGTSAAKALYVQFSSGSAAYPFYVLSTGTFWANIVSSGSATNPWYVQFPSAQAITVAALPLPSNAATETGGNLAAINANTANIPAKGQALAANSTPVVLTAAQQAALTPPTSIAVSSDNIVSMAGAALPVGRDGMSILPTYDQDVRRLLQQVLLALVEANVQRSWMLEALGSSYRSEVRESKVGGDTP